MGKPLQIPDVPDEVLAALKAKAEREGLWPWLRRSTRRC
jgi:hypothetical protein